MFKIKGVNLIFNCVLKMKIEKLSEPDKLLEYKVFFTVNMFRNDLACKN